MLDEGTFQIDEISAMYIQSELGLCKINEFFPTDLNYMIYGVPISWTVRMNCAHEITTTSKLKIMFPADFYVIETSSCIVTLQAASYQCLALNGDSSILISNFATKTIPAEEDF